LHLPYKPQAAYTDPSAGTKATGIDQNPKITADEKRQLIDNLYAGEIKPAHAGNAAFAAIDKALGK
jgi:hypothetical protein